MSWIFLFFIITGSANMFYGVTDASLWSTIIASMCFGTAILELVEIVKEN